MRRFVLQANIERFEALLAHEATESSRGWLIASIAAAKRELAVLTSAVAGVRLGPVVVGAGSSNSSGLRSQFERAFQTAPSLQMLLEPGPGLHIVDATIAYANATLIDRTKVAGLPLFDVFPDNPGDPLADGVSNLFTSLRQVALTGQIHRMAVQRYDVRDPTGQFVERYWQPSNTPVFDQHGRLIYILHEARDVTGLTSIAASS